MTNEELWRLTGALRSARGLLEEADEKLYGIFGYEDASSTKHYRIKMAASAIEDARQTLNSLEDLLKEFV